MIPISRSYHPVACNKARAGSPWRDARLAGRALLAAAAFITLSVAKALATPALVIEMPSGAVLYEDHAGQPWYPASLTKLMTAYVALSAVRAQRISLDTPLVVSARAASMPPSKMGFRPGTLVTLDAALKMLMVKSANDIAVTIAEGVSGSVEAFADDMNEAARSLGLAQSHFVNPNGLPDPEHFSSARDLALLAKALYLAFPDEADLFNIGALQLDGKIIRNHNDLLGRYPGADGMKTGFTCAAGFNVVVSATQGGRKIIAVVLGAPNLRSRAMMAATLLDRAFAGIDRPSRPVEEIAAESANSPASPPDMQQRICCNRGKAAAQYRAEVEQLMAPLLAAKTPAPAGHLVVTTAENLARPVPIAARIAMVPPAAFDPVPVRIGPPEGYAGLVAEARPPHSPVGTPQPPGTVSAYAPAAPQTEAGDTPLPPDPKALPLRSKAKPVAASPGRHARHGHRLAETQAHGAKPLATRKTAPKAALEKSKAARGKGAGKQPHAAKADLQKHSKAAAKHAPKAHTQAKTGSIHPAKAAGESPEMHAGQ